MEKIDTTCPRCDAPHARKLSLIFQEGLSTVNTTSTSVGTTSTIAPVKVTTVGSTSSIQQSQASAAASPPFIPPIRTAGQDKHTRYLWIAILWPFVMLFILPSGFGFGVKFLIVAGGFLGFFIASCTCNQAPTEMEVIAHRAQHGAQFDALDLWNETYACNSCAHRFVPAATGA